MSRLSRKDDAADLSENIPIEGVMTGLYHQITIEAPAGRVFAALATQQGLQAWGGLMRQLTHHLEGIPFNTVFTVSGRLR